MVFLHLFLVKALEKKTQSNRPSFFKIQQKKISIFTSEKRAYRFNNGTENMINRYSNGNENMIFRYSNGTENKTYK